MTLFELTLLILTAGVSGVGFASLCNALLDRIGREATSHAVPVLEAAARRR